MGQVDNEMYNLIDDSAILPVSLIDSTIKNIFLCMLAVYTEVFFRYNFTKLKISCSCLFLIF